MHVNLINLICISLTVFSILSCKSQKIDNITHKEIPLINSQTDLVKLNCQIDEKVLKKSKSGNAYVFMELRSYLGGLNILIENTNSEYCINKQRKIIDNIIQSSQTSSSIQRNRSYNDTFKGWVVTKSNKRNQSTQFREVPLFESYSFFYITQFLYILKENGWVNQSQENRDWWKKTLIFIERNEWSKWYERSFGPKRNHYWYFLRNRAHIGSHWAGIALYLKEMTTNPQIMEQCEKLKNDYDLLLKRNLKPNPKDPSAYVWNATYDNTAGTDASETKPSIIQDVSHGNHVVSYIVAAYELGDKNWSLEDIHKLGNTFKKVIYDKKNNTFADNVDGSPDSERPGRGHFLTDGWVKLSRYDKKLAELIQKSLESELIKKYNNELKLKVNLKFFKNKYGL